MRQSSKLVPSRVLRIALLGSTLAAGCRAEGSPPSSSSLALPALPTTPQLADAPATQTVNGALTFVNGQRVLNVWGTAHEMGFAHGALVRAGIIEIIDGYALEVLPAHSFEKMRAVYIAAAKISDDRRDEARGMIEGMRSVGSTQIPKLGRELEAQDLLFVNAITDLLSIGCSSLSAWGTSTSADADLSGELAVVRNLDWTDDPELLRNQLVIAYAPSATGHQRFVSVGFAGYMGCLSCFNEAGVTTLFNMGYGQGAAGLREAARGFSPANLTLRDLIEGGDNDGDGDVDADDIEGGLRARKHAGSWILHLLQPFDADSGEPPARILEVEASGVVRRDPDADTKLGGAALAATNHMREAYAPRACSRYRRIERSALESQRAFDPESMWALGESLALDEVVHTMMLRPGSRALRLRLRAPGQSMAGSPSAADHTWTQLFAAQRAATDG